MAKFYIAIRITDGKAVDHVYKLTSNSEGLSDYIRSAKFITVTPQYSDSSVPLSGDFGVLIVDNYSVLKRIIEDRSELNFEDLYSDNIFDDNFCVIIGRTAMSGAGAVVDFSESFDAITNTLSLVMTERNPNTSYISTDANINCFDILILPKSLIFSNENNTLTYDTLNVVVYIK